MPKATRKPGVSLPDGTPEFMAPAYYGSLHFAIGHEGMQKAFEADTGTKFPSAPRTALDRMIDEATGIYADYFEKFKAWHDVNVWGDINAPDESPVTEIKGKLDAV